MRPLPESPPAGRSGARRWLAIPALLVVALCASCTGRQRWAELTDFPTSSGEVIARCRLGYRTYGTLDVSRSNAVLVLPWFQGTSGELAPFIGAQRMVDSTRFFVVAVDALGNGVSCSPSNLHPFPKLGISDLVRSQVQLVRGELGLDHLHAVVGISMGGMQALAWAAEQPGFADRVVSIAGSPRSTEGDRRYWLEGSDALRATGTWGRVTGALGRLEARQAWRELHLQPENFLVQAEAIRALDLPAATGGSMERLAASLRSRLLIAVAERDEVVDPAPSRELAELARAELLVLDGRCGHRATTCERPRLVEAVRGFLEPVP